MIPDFVPVLGYLDDLVVTSLGIALAIRMIPQDVLAGCRERAQATRGQNKPTSWAAAVAVVAIWLLVAALVIVIVLRIVRD